jgi:hypothetical protein
MKRWSKLQKQLYNLVDPDLDFQLHCRLYRMKSQRGSTDLPRYWIALNGEVIWDYPRHGSARLKHYPYLTDISAISDLIREYIDTSSARLAETRFENDRWGLTDILKAADRRIGVRQFDVLSSRVNDAARRVLQARRH